MEVITITSEAFQELKNCLENINQKINSRSNQNPLSEQWLDIADVCNVLKISKRTLQSYRDQRLLDFSQIGGKIYFKASEIESHLEKHYVKSRYNR